MRLLDVHTFCLVQHFEPNVPPYAILSHRWEEEEVLFTDIETKSYKLKKGFEKVRQACNQAVKDGLAFIWIDTCCIDKSSSAELSEAINSMFRWYHEAAVCYAFLSDLILEEPVYMMNHIPFSKSLWFTRGWTLQELIAPANLVLFGPNWTHVGTRSEYARQISEASGIHWDILKERRQPLEVALRTFTVAQRMSWASKRQTTRIEDQAYSLMGIFGVNMPLLYGEGKTAFIRLQEEILKQGSDLSILAWRHGSASRQYKMELLAESPCDFAHCKGNVRSPLSDRSVADETTYTLTNTGLRIEQPLLTVFSGRDGHDRLALCLECREEGAITKVSSLKLSPRDSAIAMSTGNHQGLISNSRMCDAGWEYDGDPKGDRLIATDLVEPERSPDWPVLTIARSCIALLNMRPHPLHWHTHVWIKLPKDDTNVPWTAWKFYPEEYWDSENLTFDLSEVMRDDASEKHFAKDSMMGVEWVHGAIALSNNFGGRIAINFAQKFELVHDCRTSSQILFRVWDYDQDIFPSPPHDFGDMDTKGESSTSVMKRKLDVKLKTIRQPNILIALLEMEIEGPQPFTESGPFELEDPKSFNDTSIGPFELEDRQSVKHLIETRRQVITYYDFHAKQKAALRQSDYEFWR